MPTPTSAPCAAAHRAAHRLLCSLTTALSIGLAGCGGGGQDTATPTPAPGGSPPAGSATYSLQVDPNPITATPATDDARRVAQDVPLEGGTLSTTGADGTVYTLTVPPDALEQPTRITMTPLARIAGLPFGDDMRGVQLGPDGLQFARLVRLDMALPAGTNWPVDQQVPIGLQGSRNVVSLAPLEPTSAAPSFRLTHFSSYALVLSSKGLNASLEGLRQRLGGSEDERLTSALSGLLATERVRAMSGNPGDTDATAFMAMLNGYERQVLAPRLAAAGSSCAASRLAIQTVLGIERRRQLLGFPEADAATAGTHAALFATSAQVCMKEEFEICRDAHIVARILPARLLIERRLALLGLPDQPMDEADAYVDKCLRFELQMASTVDHQETVPFHGNLHAMSEAVDTRVTIGYRGMPDGHPLVMGAPAPLVSRSYGVTSNDPCNSISNVQRVGGQFQVFLMGWKTLDPPSDGSPAPGGPADRAKVQDFWLTVAAPQGNGSHYTLTARGHTDQGCGAPSTSVRGDNWSQAGGGDVLGTLQAGEPSPDGAPGISGWAIGNDGSELLASKDVDTPWSDAQGTSRVRMAFRLFHRPAAQ